MLEYWTRSCLVSDPGELRHCAEGFWLFDGTPPVGGFLLFGFPYTGMGAASTFSQWPRRLGNGILCPIQPPGRESRIMESPCTTSSQFGSSLADELLPHLDRPYAFVGHCGAFTHMLETALALQDLGAPLPERIFVSSWGPPQFGPYGPLNSEYPHELDLVAEVQDIAQNRLGYALDPDLAEMAADTLLADLLLQKTHHYDGSPPVPAQLVVVLSWSDDEIVPPSVTEDERWSDCASVKFHQMQGDHWEFMSCPSELQHVLTAEMGFG